MPIQGEGLSSVLILSPDVTEQAHFMLQRLLRRSGLQKEQFYFATVDDPWLRFVQDKKVRTILALGERALRASTQQSNIFRWRGRVYDNPDAGFYVIPTFRPSRLIHRRQDPERPDPEIMRNPPRYQGRWVRDLHYAVKIARDGFTRQPVRYLLDPPPGVFAKWVEEYLEALKQDPSIKLSFDIETPYKKDKEDEDELEERDSGIDLNTTILRCGFAWREYEATTVPWTPQYRDAIAAALGSDGPKVTWNGLTFDVPVIKNDGMEVRGLIYDGMDAMKAWQSDLDRGLEVTSADTTDALPWKHLSDAQPAYYNATDADVALRAVNFIHARLREQGEKTWKSYEDEIVRLTIVMKEAGERGNSIDLDYQQWLSGEIDKEAARLDAEIQKVVPEKLKPRKPYKKTPEVLQGLEGVYNAAPGARFEVDGRVFVAVYRDAPVKVCSRCGAQGVTKSEHTSKKTLDRKLVAVQHHKKCLLGDPCTCAQHAKGWPKRKWESTPNPCHDAPIEVRQLPTLQWDEVLPFNAGSSQQLIAYMKAHRHPVGQHKDDPDGESADAKHLMVLKKRYGAEHPLYGLALDKHKVDKAKSTYLWIPRADGRIGQTYVNSPSTFRYGGRAYNLMNVGKRYDPDDPEQGNKWAWLARNQITARPGYVFVQVDSTSVEGVMQGWYMGSRHFMWLANQSVHAWLATKKLGWDFNKDTIAKVKRDHKNLYDAMKVMNYRTLFGGSAYSAWKDNPETFPTLESAQEAQNTIFELLPELEAYQYSVRYRAHKQTYLESPWGLRHYFYDVFTYARDKYGELRRNPRGLPILKLGKDGKRVVAFEPQHSNAMFQRRNLLLISESEWRDYMPANVFVHDGITLEVPIRLAEKAMEFVLGVMTRPIPEMGNLRVGAAADIGYNWGTFHEVHNPKGMKEVAKVVIEEQDLLWMPETPTLKKFKEAA